jgi:hypothetical protein
MRPDRPVTSFLTHLVRCRTFNIIEFLQNVGFEFVRRGSILQRHMTHRAFYVDEAYESGEIRA